MTTDRMKMNRDVIRDQSLEYAGLYSEAEQKSKGMEGEIDGITTESFPSQRKQKRFL